MSNIFDPAQANHFVGPDIGPAAGPHLGPNCLQKL